MKLSMQSLARKLSIPSPKRGKKQQQQDGSGKRGISRSEAPSFASASSSSTSSSSEDALPRASTPRSVLPAEISRRELEAVLRRLGHEEPSDDELDAVAAIAAAGEAGPEDELMEAFNVFDADGDGRITAEELRGVLLAILGGEADGCSLDDCRRMIGGVDADGDGFVGFQDFARMMMVSTAAATTSAGPRFL
ncbi:probable calcium-binding protein CML35 [Triticum urartu]|uniref:probable calcium-binding protein CML35 n=1 Tax=Triticum urartu TaxID=4572 RepID=UPI0020436188|nr:probable calcium-binding protein CML35 [Triticum urartu]XP_048566139.1 probable calcium-binding protein CML35 [Triticum urartu]